MPAHFDLLIRHGTCVLPWGAEATDVGVRNGRIAALGVRADATAGRNDRRQGLHVLPGLIDPHVHLRDPGDKAVETIPTGTRAAVLGGLAAVFDMPNTAPSITDAEKLAWKQEYVERESWCDIGPYVGGTKTNIPELAKLELGRGVCGIKIFAGSSTGDLMVEDDEHLERVMRSGRRRIAYHSEDEYRLQDRKPMFKSGDPYRRHMEWRDDERAFLGTRRLMALARTTGRPAHILHVSTAEELDYLKDFRDLATCEVLVNHLTQVAPDCYDNLKGFGVMNPPIRGPEARRRAGRRSTTGRWTPLAPTMRRIAREKIAAVAGLPGRPDRRADDRAGDAEPRECRTAVADAHGRPDVCGAGAGLWRGRQRPAGRRLRRGLHAGGHEAAAADRRILDRLALRLDAVRRHGHHRLAGRRDRAWPAGDAR